MFRLFIVPIPTYCIKISSKNNRTSFVSYRINSFIFQHNFNDSVNKHYHIKPEHLFLAAGHTSKEKDQYVSQLTANNTTVSWWTKYRLITIYKWYSLAICKISTNLTKAKQVPQLFHVDEALINLLQTIFQKNYIFIKGTNINTKWITVAVQKNSGWQIVGH